MHGWLLDKYPFSNIFVAGLNSSIDKSQLPNLLWQTKNGRDMGNDCIHIKYVDEVGNPLLLENLIVDGGLEIQLSDSSETVTSYTMANSHYGTESVGGIYHWWGIPTIGKIRPTLGSTFFVSVRFTYSETNNEYIRKTGSQGISLKVISYTWKPGQDGYRYNSYEFTSTRQCWKNGTEVQGKWSIPEGRHAVPRDILEALENAQNNIGHSRSGKDYIAFVKPIYDTLVNAFKNDEEYWHGQQHYPKTEFTDVLKDPVAVTGYATFPQLTESLLLLHEDDRIRDKIGYADFLHDGSRFAYEQLTERAFVNSLEGITTLSDNSIQNVLEIVSFMYGLTKGRIDIPDSLSSLWLAYRYTYGTGKADVEDAIKFVHDHLTLDDICSGVRLYGNSSWSFKGVEIKCTCSLSIKLHAIATIRDAWNTLYLYGLQPNFYVIWDLIPLSFIVDWFVPVGDALHIKDIEQTYLTGTWDISDMNYSFSYFQDIPSGHHVKCYSRWRSEIPQHLNGLYWLWSHPVSKRQIGCRILDAASLIFS